MIERIVVAGGGTGGHLFSGIAVVEELRRRQPDLNVLFIGTERGIEARLLPQLGETVAFIPATPLMGRTLAVLAQSVVKLPKAVSRALTLLREHKPDLVLGLGGYASGPVLLAAKLMGIPTGLLEQNAYLGLANRMLAPFVGRAYLAHENASCYFKPGRALVCGNPVRRSFVEGARMAASDPSGLEARSCHILVLGGSQGAQVLNQVVPEALTRAGLAKRGIHILHQTGESMREAVEKRYQEHGITAEVVPFIEDMARAYASAVLVIARAGATSLAEMCAIGRPAILIPYAHAAEDHQSKNAESLASVGAALVLREQGLTADYLALRVCDLLDDEGRRRTMAEAARRKGRPEAAAVIVDDLYAWLGHQIIRGPSADSGAAQPSETNEPSDASGCESANAACRKPKVKRCELRIHERDRELTTTADATA
jgi:UDP-N-acetylglucosamine--N-acetylmuramyl-(pentapeptide) pyrophosphoryl-undecaprenol N-acetylglucosamine transferase